MPVPGVDPEVEAETEYRMRVLEPGFSDRVVVPPGDRLYDPMLGWTSPVDHSLILCDIGGQPERGWDPARGHGSILRLRADDVLETIVGPENIGGGMPMSPREATGEFGSYGGRIFYVGQTLPGRHGALSEHAVFIVEDNVGKIFSSLPHAGKQGNGIPGALCIGGFGPKGTAEEGYYFCNSQMNCVVYRVDPDGHPDVWLVLDEPNLPFSVMPYRVFWAGPSWGDLEGTMMVAGLAGSSFEREAPTGNIVKYFTIKDGKVSKDPVREADLGYSMAVVAPPEFGPFGGHTFLVDFGSVNLMHVTKPEPGPLPYNSRIVRIDPEGNEHTFADGLQSGWNEVVFDGPRMVVGCLRRSYSTGEYHEPDGSLYEIKYEAK